MKVFAFKQIIEQFSEDSELVLAVVDEEKKELKFITEYFGIHEFEHDNPLNGTDAFDDFIDSEKIVLIVYSEDSKSNLKDYSILISDEK